MPAIGVTTVYDAPCKCGKGRFLVTKSPPAPEFVTEIFSHLVPEIACPDCAKVFTLIEWNGEICLLRTADVAARKEAQAAYWQKAKNVENLANSIGYYDALTDWLLSFESAAAALGTLGDLTSGLYWEEAFQKAFSAKPDTAPMKALVKPLAGCPSIYEILKRQGKSFPELERLIEIWHQQELPIVPIVEKLCPY